MPGRMRTACRRGADVEQRDRRSGEWAGAHSYSRLRRHQSAGRAAHAHRRGDHRGHDAGGDRSGLELQLHGVAGGRVAHELARAGARAGCCRLRFCAPIGARSALCLRYLEDRSAGRLHQRSVSGRRCRLHGVRVGQSPDAPVSDCLQRSAGDRWRWPDRQYRLGVPARRSGASPWRRALTPHASEHAAHDHDRCPRR